MLENIKQTITRWDERNPWTNVYGLARSIIALSSLLTLLINHPSLIMKPASGISSYPACKMNLSLFCLGENNYMMLNLFRWVCIAILVLVVIGWRPRITIMEGRAKLTEAHHGIQEEQSLLFQARNALQSEKLLDPQ